VTNELTPAQRIQKGLEETSPSAKQQPFNIDPDAIAADPTLLDRMGSRARIGYGFHQRQADRQVGERLQQQRADREAENQVIQRFKAQSPADEVPTTAHRVAQTKNGAEK